MFREPEYCVSIMLPTMEPPAPPTSPGSTKLPATGTNTSSMPESSPGTLMGNTMFVKVFALLAPRISDAWMTLSLMPSSEE